MFGEISNPPMSVVCRILVLVCLLSLGVLAQRKTTTAPPPPPPTTTAPPPPPTTTVYSGTYAPNSRWNLFNGTTQEEEQMNEDEAVGTRVVVLANNLYAYKLRYYNPSSNTAQVTGRLWNVTSNSNTVLVELQFPVPTGAGYLEVNIPTPIPLRTSDVYVTSYLGAQWRAKTLNTPLLNAAITNGPLVALANSNGGNGLSGGIYTPPNDSYGGNHFYADIVVGN